MLSSRRAFLGTSVAVLALSLAGCTGLTPIYGSPHTKGGVSLAYDAPGNRTEQIIYEDLALRMPRGGAGIPKLSVSARQWSTNLTSGLVSTAQDQRQMNVAATFTLRDPNGNVLLSADRTATADYTTDAQIIASRAAADDATARAAHLLADSIRLAVLGALAK